ncbi:DinB family protein [Microlunatus soli]|uniref:Mycothiol maleylpyruvate isomerase N-terminal domain-containing protein n=1 Tax=Microlunatus soli TaxID=630515 RepID=A0A1H2AEQ0_9ACTN|nr:DinB family protein [Microlunatus soli]SDT44394.1 Mycothiol maleylpyruvate isomerase N-terminal domain-containing protein [Microlunatus soli]
MSQIQHAVPIAVQRCVICGFDFGTGLDDCVTHATELPELLQETLGKVDSAAVRHRLAPWEWSMLEYGAHLGEVIPWYLGRVQQVLDEDRPQLQPMDWTIEAEVGEYRRRSVQRVCADVDQACRSLIAMINSLDDDHLRREGIGSDGSPRTIEVLLTRADHEIIHHERDLRRALDRLQG